MNIIIPKIPEKTIALPDKKEILKGVLVIALAHAQIAGAHPFGLAMAATFAPESAYIALIGLCTGMAGIGVPAVKYILAFFLYYTLVHIKKAEDVNVKTVAMGAAVLFSQLAGFFWEGGFDALKAVMLVPETVITAGAFRLFACLEEKNGVTRFAELLIIGAVLNGIKDAVIPYAEINASAFAIIFILMSLCYALEMPEAVLSAAVIGFIMNMDSAEAVAAAGAFAASAVFSCALSGMGKAGTAVGFLCGITVVSLYRGNLGGMQPLDVFIPVAVFMILPEGVHMRITCFIDRQFEDEIREEETVNARIAHQLRTVAKAVCDLADGVNFLSGRNKEDTVMIEMFDNIASRVCDGCSLQGNCWRKDSSKTYDNMYGLWQAMEADGYCDYSNMPLGFKQVCMRVERFLAEFNHVYELYKQNTLLKGEAVSGRGIMARQYGEISRIINLLSQEVETGCGEKELPAAKFSVKVTVRQEAKRGCAVCGDSILHFEKDGRYYVILCDGMGSGEEAMSESRLTARLFYEFLNAGFEKETALNMINSALALKADQESFSTADILEINMETGVGEFLKIGSAQSFVKTKSAVEEILSKALPVGILENVEVTAQSTELRNNDLILMISDGVGEAGSGVLKNEWIKKLLTMDNRNDEELAELILAGAKSRMKFSDDMTCAVVRIKRRREI